MYKTQQDEGAVVVSDKFMQNFYAQDQKDSPWSDPGWRGDRMCQSQIEL